MKKVDFLLCVLCSFIISNCHAQNVFPDSGYVGIGTTTPAALLHVNGEIILDVNTNLRGGGSLVFGHDALGSNTTGTNNIAFGGFALQDNTIGGYNTAIGISSLNNNVSGSFNVAIGEQSLSKGGSYNTAVGTFAQLGNLIGNNNTAIGANTLYQSGKGDYNTAVGFNTLYFNVKGDYNTCIGAVSFQNNTSGDYNCSLGYLSEVSAANFSNASAIGYSALVDAGNKMRFGNSSVTSNGGQVEWTAYSDARIKNKIQDNVPGLEFINLLQPVTYHFDIKKENQILGVSDTANWDGKYDIEKMQWTGFIAQDVDAAAKKINYDFSGVDKSGNIMGLRYSEFVVPLVKAVQQLSADNDAKQNQIEAQNTAIQNLQQQIDDLKNAIGIIPLSPINTQESKIEKTNISFSSGAWLGQNIPNPFSNTTIVRCFIPQGSSKAEFVIYDNHGSVLNSTELKITGINEITIDADALAAGAYAYGLLIDGKLIDSKQMIIAK